MTGRTQRSMQIAHFSDSSNMFSLAVPSAAAAAGCWSAGAAEAAFAVVASAETATALTLPVG